MVIALLNRPPFFPQQQYNRIMFHSSINTKAIAQFRSWGGILNELIVRSFRMQPHQGTVLPTRSRLHRIVLWRREQRRRIQHDVLPLGTTPPISLKLTHPYEAIPAPPSVKVTNDDVARLTQELQVILQDYNTKDSSRRDDVWLELRTGPQYRHIIDSMQQLLLADHNLLSFYQVWERVPIAAIFQLRLDVESWIAQTEGHRLDVDLVHNNLYDSKESKEMWDQVDEQIVTAKSWNAMIVRILLHRIPNHVVVRPILPEDVTLDLIKVSTVHDELPDHYNECFNPYMGATNRVYGIFFNNPKDERCQREPIVVLCVSLQPRVPRSLRDIFCPVVKADAPPNPVRNHVATFYSILNLQHYQYSKLRLGELLIQKAVGLLQDEFKNADDVHKIDTFVTLSPIPGFCSWLMNEMDIYLQYCSDDFMEDGNGNGIIRKKPTLHRTILYLAKHWLCAEEDVMTQISILLYKMNEKERNTKPSKKSQNSKKAMALKYMDSGPSVETTPQIMTAVRFLLESMAAHYICHVKLGHTNGTTTMVTTQGNEHLKPSNGVARFHLQNGAEVFRVNAFADVSVTGITDSFSVMVNYRYDLSRLAENQKQYAKNYTVMVHDYVNQQMQ
jgi:Malonyl-CoA decarboxylase C-terminal domain